MSEPSLRELMFRRRTAGRVRWIGLRPARGEPMLEVPEVELLLGHGPRGDYTSGGRGGGKRQLTLLQAEHLDVLARLTGRAQVTPRELRRNVLVEGINLLAFKATTFRIGGVVLEGSGGCEPCRKMEHALGEGGYNALRGHGGITARVLVGGVIRVGDEVDFAAKPQA